VTSELRTEPLMEAFDWDRLERVVVLSPHIDDAVLSCTGLLSALDKVAPRLVVTLYCGNPEPAISEKETGRARLRKRRGHAAPSVRRREDLAVMRYLRCAWVHLGFPEAIYRRSPTMGRLIYRHPRQKWTRPNVADTAHMEELFLVLRRLCANMGPRLLVSPLGVGHHVDHRICAMTALRLAGGQTRVLFYEDFPYVVGGGGGYAGDDPLKAFARLGLEPRRRYAVPASTARQIKALSLYESQIGPLFGDEDGMRKALKARSTYRGRPCDFLWAARPVSGTGEGPPRPDGQGMEP
jgi:LmbE family N-acetylglucosaminyl deacetylase